MENIRRKIFIVDDNVGSLTMTKSQLKSRYELIENVMPDLILLDIRMPDMDGYEIIKKLKSNRRFAEVPVIFVTSKSDEESEIRGFELGAVDYITKPYDSDTQSHHVEGRDN